MAKRNANDRGGEPRKYIGRREAGMGEVVKSLDELNAIAKREMAATQRVEVRQIASLCHQGKIYEESEGFSVIIYQWHIARAGPVFLFSPGSPLAGTAVSL